MVAGFPEQGLWHLTASQDHEYVGVKKSVFKDTRVFIKVKCDPLDPNPDNNLIIKISWLVRKTPCWNDYIFSQATEERYMQYFYDNPGRTQNTSKFDTGYLKTLPVSYPCDHNIILNPLDMDKVIMETNEGAKATRAVAEAGGGQPLKENEDQLLSEEEGKAAPVVKSTEAAVQIGFPPNNGPEGPRTRHPVMNIPKDGVYLLVVHTTSMGTGINLSYTAEVTIEMESDYGYLSAVDWPLLGFYAAMCGVYLIYGVAWLVMSALRWRELLRVQYWIGAVIFLGMLEKAVFTAEYSSLNKRGYSVSGLIVFAELVSCAKRTLARMLVIIVSLGFGIVKPRLGVVLHRVVGVGLLYFILASIEGCTRALQSRVDPQRQVLLASLPLSLLESAICFWIFSALVQTTRTLRLRRNLVKLSLYRHFTNTLAFAVLASVVFMLWSITYHEFEDCLRDWKELWVDDAYWHVLFAIILLVIMILWRPSNNNQRFAFTPLLDDGSDADDEEESEKLMADISDTMKYRNTKGSTSSSPRESRSVEEDLKWVEENIPSSLADNALPILDSDEEILTTKFEFSKMQ
ncbi:hypothetical protein Pcinc_031373 [Petrolisthes cinctipes]|uniref:Transmembrane protein 87A n=1 Tax=Petrolisthes cinctipes TaxID=88211 RepID=A0AAE1K4Y5_PETCI|nr:hypothetical protein Pcinc_031373 [Petrolisthes cinctipes]